jgi:hypothetical protein
MTVLSLVRKIPMPNYPQTGHTKTLFPEIPIGSTNSSLSQKVNL